MAKPVPDTGLLDALLRTPVDVAIPSDGLKLALSQPPFARIPGSLNLRDLGAFAPDHVAPGKIFRSGMLDLIPPSSLPLLATQLGVYRIYDLRGNDEIRGPVAASQIDGLEVVSCPYMDGERQPGAIVVPDFAPQEDGTLGTGYRKMYEDILEGYTTGFKRAFEGLRDAGDGQAILFHCTAGKDRTGVLSALILDLVDLPAAMIGMEYALTRIGTEPFRKQLLPAALKGLGVTVSNQDLASSNLDALAAHPGLKELLSTDAAVMIDFVAYIHDRYGGAEGYLKEKLGLAEDEIEFIRKKIASQVDSSTR